LHLDGSPHVIRLRRSLYGTSMPGAGAVHHIKTGNAQSEQLLSANGSIADMTTVQPLNTSRVIGRATSSLMFPRKFPVATK
jgi:hypothetical protein